MQIGAIRGRLDLHLAKEVPHRLRSLSECRRDGASVPVNAVGQETQLHQAPVTPPEFAAEIVVLLIGERFCGCRRHSEKAKVYHDDAAGAIYAEESGNQPIFDLPGLRPCDQLDRRRGDVVARNSRDS